MKKLFSSNDSKNRVAGYKRHLSSHKEDLAKERLRYIEHKCPFVVGDKVLISHGARQYTGAVKRINLKTITVIGDSGTTYRVDKISLHGHPTFVFNAGESKAKAFEYMSIKKVGNHDGDIL